MFRKIILKLVQKKLSNIIIKFYNAFHEYFYAVKNILYFYYELNFSSTSKSKENVNERKQTLIGNLYNLNATLIEFKIIFLLPKYTIIKTYLIALLIIVYLGSNKTAWMCIIAYTYRLVYCTGLIFSENGL